MLSYRASLDLPHALAVAVAALLAAHRRLLGTRRGRRVLGAFAHAVLVLRWMRQRAPVADLARDNGLSLATAYRYVHEGLAVLAAQAPDLPEVIALARAAGTEHLLLDGTLVPTDRVHDEGGPDRWYSGKHKRHGGNIQVLTDPDGRPLWVSPVTPGATHDLAAARAHVLPALYPAAVRGLPVLADKGYTGAGAGIRVPARAPRGTRQLDSATRGWNSYINTNRAYVEHGIGHLKTRWRALRHVTLCPHRITTIAAAALVLTHLENAY